MGVSFPKNSKIHKDTRINLSKLDNIKSDKDMLRKYNYKTAKAAIKKGLKTCFILFCFLGFIDYISFKSGLLLDSIAGIFIVIALGTVINISKRWIKANKKGLFITDNLDLVESLEMNSLSMDKEECLNESTNGRRQKIKVKK